MVPQIRPRPLPFLTHSVLILKFEAMQSELLAMTSERPHRKHRFLCYCVSIHCRRDVSTAQLRGKESGPDPQRTSLATSFLLLRDVTMYVTSSSPACVRVITYQRLFSASTVFALSLQLGGWAWGEKLLTLKNKPRTWTDSLYNGPRLISYTVADK
jgi:hypothetical protein